MTITNVEFNPKFLDALKAITNINPDLVIKEWNDKISIRAQSKGKEIIIDIKAPITGFNFKEGLVGIKDFNKFYKVYSVVDNPSIKIKHLDDKTKEENVKALIVDGKTTKIEFASHNPRKLGMSDKDELPAFTESDSFTFDVDEETLKNLKSLTSALIEQAAEKGTRLDVFKEAGAEQVKFRFKGLTANGNSFDKTFDIEGCNKEISLNFDPLFFSWMPNGDYKVRVVDGPAKFIMAQTTVKDEDESEICTYSFIAGKLNSAFQKPE